MEKIDLFNQDFRLELSIASSTIINALSCIQRDFENSQMRMHFKNFSDMSVKTRIELIDILVSQSLKPINCIFCRKPIPANELRNISSLGHGHISCTNKFLGEN